MSGLALVAECNKKVGSGHAVVTRNLVDLLTSVECRAYLTKGTPRRILNSFRRRPKTIPDLAVGTLMSVAVDARSRGLKAAVLNALQVTPAMVKALKSGGLKVVALSVNRNVPGADMSLTMGPSNMILSPAISALAAKPRSHRGPVKNLMILMGGTDSSGSTARLVRVLAGRLPGVRKSVIAGPNFARFAELHRALTSAKDRSFVLFRSPKNLPVLMSRVDAAITLGSNTSLELACAGTPMILMEEAPHERRLARLLARKGCGLFAGSQREATSERVLAALKRLDDPALRARMARVGRSVVNGRGAERLAAKLRKLSA